MPRLTAAAQVQRRLWGTDPRAWAELAEPHNRPLFEAVLHAASVGPGTRLLDVGCGSGLTLVLAQERGAIPVGLDISPGLLGIARERLPEAVLREGDMEFLPFDDDSFDAVTGVNAFQFAGDPQQALREAARVTRPGGRVVASLFAAPERSQGTVVHEAMSALIPPERAADHAPYALSAPGNLEAALANAGLRVTDHGEVVCHWRYASMDEAVRALLCSAGGARAVQAAGQHRGPRRPRARPGTVPGPANRRRLPDEHLPVGRGVMTGRHGWPARSGPRGSKPPQRRPAGSWSAGPPCRMRDRISASEAGRAEGPGLDQRVAPAGRLGRPGHHRELAGVRDQLAEHRVGHAAAHDVNGPHRPGRSAGPRRGPRA